eukprot:3562864-Alexandrium_andersonii.AAC.1
MFGGFSRCSDALQRSEHAVTHLPLKDLCCMPDLVMCEQTRQTQTSVFGARSFSDRGGVPKVAKRGVFAPRGGVLEY